AAIRGAQGSIGGVARPLLESSAIGKSPVVSNGKWWVESQSVGAEVRQRSAIHVEQSNEGALSRESIEHERAAARLGQVARTGDKKWRENFLPIGNVKGAAAGFLQKHAAIGIKRRAARDPQRSAVEGQNSRRSAHARRAEV